MRSSRRCSTPLPTPACYGRVWVDWRQSTGPEAELRSVWREVGGPAFAPPTRRGFGARLIERNLRHDLAGTLKVRYEPDGFEAEISIPLEREPWL